MSQIELFRNPERLRSPLRLLLIYGLAAAISLVALFPFYWMFTTSIKDPAEVYFTPPTLVPESFTLSHYEEVLTNAAFVRFFINSLLIASITVIIVLVLAIPAAYSLGRAKYRGRLGFSRFIFVFYLFPGVLLLVPLYLLISKLQLQDNPLGLVIVYTTFMAPYATILIREYLMQIPRELEDAAFVDGASQWRVIWSIITPLARPGIAVAAIITFIGSWSEFIMASMLTVSQSNKTLPVGLYEWMGTYDIEWGRLTSGAVITAIPILVLFIIMGRVLIRGLLGGAMKG
ncbi:MAG: ABC transporter permease subunit [Anaerolineales bacterium]|nr:ABC transporter permease subunit [Anaerolineales bacterium]